MAMKTRHEEPVGRTLVDSMRRPSGMTLDLRPRQLRDEDKSCGNQPAYIRVIYRRLSLLMSRLIAVYLNKESAGPPKACEDVLRPGRRMLFIYRSGNVLTQGLTG
jgi:hypothetical protein